MAVCMSTFKVVMCTQRLLCCGGCCQVRVVGDELNTYKHILQDSSKWEVARAPNEVCVCEENEPLTHQHRLVGCEEEMNATCHVAGSHPNSSAGLPACRSSPSRALKGLEIAGPTGCCPGRLLHYSNLHLFHVLDHDKAKTRIALFLQLTGHNSTYPHQSAAGNDSAVTLLPTCTCPVCRLCSA